MKSNYRRFKLLVILICGLVAFFAQASGARAGTLTVNTEADNPVISPYRQFSSHED